MAVIQSSAINYSLFPWRRALGILITLFIVDLVLMQTKFIGSLGASLGGDILSFLLTAFTPIVMKLIVLWLIVKKAVSYRKTLLSIGIIYMIVATIPFIFWSK